MCAGEPSMSTDLCLLISSGMRNNEIDRGDGRAWLYDRLDGGEARRDMQGGFTQDHCTGVSMSK